MSKDELNALRYQYEGRAIVKDFGSEGIFKGVVKKMWRDRQGIVYARLKYEDDDTEDVEVDELQSLLPRAAPYATAPEPVKTSKSKANQQGKRKAEKQDDGDKKPAAKAVKREGKENVKGNKGRGKVVEGKPKRAQEEESSSSSSDSDDSSDSSEEEGTDKEEEEDEEKGDKKATSGGSEISFKFKNTADFHLLSMVQEEDKPAKKKQPKGLTDMEQLRAKYLNRRVFKMFDDEGFYGKIDDVWSDPKDGKLWLHVTYEDDDAEDLTPRQVDKILLKGR